MIPLGKRKKKKRRRKKRSGNFTCYEDMKQLEITKVMETILNVLSTSSFCIKPSVSDVDDTVSSVFSAQMKNKLCWTDCFLYINNWKLELSVLRNDELDRLWSIKMIIIEKFIEDIFLFFILGSSLSWINIGFRTIKTDSVFYPISYTVL